MENIIKKYKAILLAILAAALYSINSPISKLLLKDVTPTMLASFLYLGAGIGLLITGIIMKLCKKDIKETSLTKKELPFTIGMIVLDIAAPIFLMMGLNYTTAANASLLNNFEIVATSIIALFIFKEYISKKLWLAIILVTTSSVILSFEISSLSFSIGSIFVLLACICWGMENNCTRMLSSKNPMQIVVLKGVFSGLGSYIIALILGERIPDIIFIIIALSVGFVSYGLSIFFYIYAQRDLGAARTSAYYAIAPFIGAFLSLIIFRQLPSITFIVALFIMAIGAYFASTDNI